MELPEIITKDITKPERPVKELFVFFRSRGSKSCAWRS